MLLNPDCHDENYQSSPPQVLNQIHRKTPDGYSSIDVENVQKDHESKKKMKPRKTLDVDDQNNLDYYAKNIDLDDIIIEGVR